MPENLNKLVGSIATMGGVGFMTVIAEGHGLLSATFAAWVQAIGSIAAIYGAGYIADRQNRIERAREQRAREEAAADRRERNLTLHRTPVSILGLSDIRLTALSEALLDEQSEYIGKLSIGRLETILQLINKFDPFQLENPRSIHCYAQAQSIVHDIVCHARNEEALSNSVAAPSTRMVVIKRLSQSLAEAAGAIREQVAELSEPLRS